MEDQNKLIHEVTQRDYRFGFVSDIETDTIVKGLNEEVIRIISAKKDEPEFMLEFRLKAYRRWLTMKMPEWAQLKIPQIDYQDIILYSMLLQHSKRNMKASTKLIRNCYVPSRNWGYRSRNRKCFPALPSTQSLTVFR